MEFLYVIIPYFNFKNYISGLENLHQCFKNLSLYKNVRIVLVEGVYQQNCLPKLSEQIFKHITVPLKDILWVKENLINKGFDNLPSDWEYACWLDRDILFTNNNWVHETIQKLKSYDIIQPWSQCLFLDKNKCLQPAELAVYSFCFSFCENIDTPHFKHPGQVWAINKQFFRKLQGLYEYCILGGADSYLAMCIDSTINKDVFESTYTNRKSQYGNTLQLFKEKFKDVKTNYVYGVIIHYYHGEIVKRNYSTREEILIKNNFDLNKHITKDENNVLMYTQEGKFLEKYVSLYFKRRQEDN